MLNGALLLSSVLGRLVVRMRVRGSVRVTGTATVVAGACSGVERRQIGPLRGRRTKRGDVGKRGAVRRYSNPTAGGVG